MRTAFPHALLLLPLHRVPGALVGRAQGVEGQACREWCGLFRAQPFVLQERRAECLPFVDHAATPAAALETFARPEEWPAALEAQAQIHEMNAAPPTMR
jgi:hypothetical protein